MTLEHWPERKCLIIMTGRAADRADNGLESGGDGADVVLERFSEEASTPTEAMGGWVKS